MSNSLSSLLSLNEVTVKTMTKIIKHTIIVLISTINKTTHQGIIHVILPVSSILNKL